MKLILPAAALRAAFIVAAKQDVRYYLNGVFISKAGDIIATDGHRLIAMCIGVELPEDFPERGVILSRPPSTIPARLPDDNITVDLNLEQWTGTMDWNMGIFPITVIDGNFPDWNRVIPREAHPEDCFWGVSTKYLADLPRISKALGTLNNNVKMMLPADSNSSATFDFKWGGANEPHTAIYVQMGVKL